MLKLKNKVTRWVLLILWMGLIFYMSSMDGTKSSEQSGFILKLIQLTGIDANGVINGTLTFIIRKLGHFTEYMILYVLIYRVVALYTYTKKSLLISIMVLFLYACSDEFHQCFSPGREPAFRDVLIDTCGGSVACFFIIVKKKLKNIRYEKTLCN